MERSQSVSFHEKITGTNQEDHQNADLLTVDLKYRLCEKDVSVLSV